MCMQNERQRKRKRAKWEIARELEQTDKPMEKRGGSRRNKLKKL